MVEILSWIGVIFNIVGGILNVKRYKISFIFYFISSLMLLIINIIKKDIGMCVLFTGFLILNIYGVVEWTKNKNIK